jgi:Mn-dependent DtxR family transcriptional regulator
LSKKIYESGEDYLETILILSQRNPAVRSIDVVREMELSKPSVSRAMGILREGGYITIDDNGYITLTDEGRNVAETIYERHRVFTNWLIWLGVTPETAAQDACRLEHAISHESFEKLKRHIEENNEKHDG